MPRTYIILSNFTDSCIFMGVMEVNDGFHILGRPAFGYTEPLLPLHSWWKCNLRTCAEQSWQLTSVLRHLCWGCSLPLIPSPHFTPRCELQHFLPPPALKSSLTALAQCKTQSACSGVKLRACCHGVCASPSHLEQAFQPRSALSVRWGLLSLFVVMQYCAAFSEGKGKNCLPIWLWFLDDLFCTSSE